MERLTYTSGSLSALGERFEAAFAGAREIAPAPFTHLIAGRAESDGGLFEQRDPSGVSVHARRAHAAGAESAARAVAAARAASAEWASTPHRERCTHMRLLARALGERHVELAATISLETGKIRAESIAEVQEAIDLIETYCAAIEAADGYSAPLTGVTPGERCFETLRPYGAFGVIAPFNFPLALSVNMAGAALIAGNTVVFKPSQATPWTAALLGEAVACAQLPSGAFNLVHGGADTGRALAAADIAGIAFTGSVPVGRELAGTLSRGRWARPVLAEMGGKNSAIVTEHADLQKAAEGIARAAFGFSGQKCSSCSRAIVHAAVHDELVECLCAYAESLVVEDPAERDAALGPVIDARASARFERSVAAARDAGRIVLGGARIERAGNFVQPTIVCDLPPAHPLEREELFLPFLTVVRVTSLPHAIAEANAVDYGLTAGIFSEREDEVQRFLEEIEAGVLYVNRRAGATTGAWPGAQSFCGWKASGLTGKGGLGPYYLPQFMREQSRTIAE